MTNLEVAYGQLLESRRANVEKEQETRRHNLATEIVSERTLDEAARHNVAAEQESVRHAQATEAIDRGKLQIEVDKLQPTIDKLRAEVGKLNTAQAVDLSQEEVNNVKAALDRVNIDKAVEDIRKLTYDTENVRLKNAYQQMANAMEQIELTYADAAKSAEISLTQAKALEAQANKALKATETVHNELNNQIQTDTYGLERTGQIVNKVNNIINAPLRLLTSIFGFGETVGAFE